jgi:hypothetical protein
MQFVARGEFWGYFPVFENEKGGFGSLILI